MILVYSSQQTARLNYILGVFLQNLAGYDYQLSCHWEEYLAFEGPKINYSTDYDETGLFIPASGLLYSKGTDLSEPPYGRGAGATRLFPVDDPRSCMNFDPFAASFYLLSLYDEYLPHPCDQHGRIVPESTVVVRHGFADRPVVEQWALALREVITRKYGLAPQHEKKFRFQPSFDIDQAWSYLHKGLARNLKGLLRDLLRGKTALVSERIKVLSGHLPDPFDSYDYLLKIHEQYGLPMPVFFILSGDSGPFDKNLPITEPHFRKLILKLDCNGNCGIHPSYNTMTSASKLKAEVSSLSALLSGPVRLSRQHYLRFTVPGTFRNLVSAGITDDYSLGFASLPGFRAGISSAFPFYDLEKEEETKLMLHPLSYMEGTLKDYLGKSQEEAILVIEQLMNEVKAVNGTFIPLWHNESLGEGGRWKGWRIVYERMLEMAAK